MTPEFVAAVRPLIVWRRANGWRLTSTWHLHLYVCDDWSVDVGTGRDTVIYVKLYTSSRGGTLVCEHHLRSVREAAKVLAALGLLPVDLLHEVALVA